MNIAGYKFELLGDIEPVRELNGDVRRFLPQNRYENRTGLPLNQYGAGPFCKFKIPAHKASGVYVVTVGDEPRYVGECKDLTVRFNNGYGSISPRNCFKGGQETNCRLNNLIYNAATAGDRISLWFFETDGFKQIEAVLRSALGLTWNKN